MLDASPSQRTIEDEEFVVKIGWIDVLREPEHKIIMLARNEVNKAEYDETDEELSGIDETGLGLLGGWRDWTTHLPKVFCSRRFQKYRTSNIRVELGIESTMAQQAGRVLVVLVERKMTGLLVDLEGRERLQGLLECLRVHRRLWKAGIHHRDISDGNLMYRKGSDGRIYGVLNDWDLSSLDIPNRTIGHERTGTIPFMAIELLTSGDNPSAHLYRHDLESFFWLFVWCATNRRAGVSQTWTERNSASAHKGVFISIGEMTLIPLMKGDHVITDQTLWDLIVELRLRLRLLYQAADKPERSDLPRASQNRNTAALPLLRDWSPSSTYSIKLFNEFISEAVFTMIEYLMVDGAHAIL